MSGPRVEVSPDVRFGSPAMRGISTEAIAEHYWAGDDVEADYDLTRHELLVVLWFQGLNGSRSNRYQWGAWAHRVAPLLGKVSELDPGAVELPPIIGDDPGGLPAG